jgi:LasA protease
MTRRVQVVMLTLAAATMACQAVFADNPTPVQPIPHPSQPATGSPAPGTSSPANAAATATATRGVQLNAPTATPLVTPLGADSTVMALTEPPPPGADYQAQSGDTLPALALRFRTDPDTVLQANPGLPQTQTIAPGTWLNLPTDGIPADAYATRLLPDSQVIDTPAALSFDVQAFVQAQPGFLATYTEVVSQTQAAKPGWQIVADFARDYSINPRVLLALLEVQSHALSDPNPDPVLLDHPLNAIGPSMLVGLSHQLGWAGNQLNYGFYGWQDGSLLTFATTDGSLHSGDGRLNPGSFAVARLLALLHNRGDFAQLTAPEGFVAVYRRLFGDALAADDTPLIPGGLTQPDMQLPFEPGRSWAFTSGPHPGFGSTLPWGAIDFAPPAEQPGCAESAEWDVAVRAGQVVYSQDGLVELDVGGGWTVVYLHVETRDRAPVGTLVPAGGRLGHPSCEGGEATASHLHLSRRYNGEWIPADGFAPFVLSGWTAHAGAGPYKGTLTNGDVTIEACSCANARTRLELP